MRAKTRDWAVALSYVALIYATLEVARLPLAYLRAHNWLRRSLAILFSLTAVGLITVIVRRHRASVSRFLVLALVGGIYVFAARFVKTPEEQLHFFEYGLVGIFFFRALRHDVMRASSLYVGAWALAFAAGWMDELLQGLMPHRYYDIHDVALNGVSAALGLIVYTVIRHPTNTTKRQLVY